MDLNIWTGAGIKFFAATQVFEDLPADLLLRSDYLLSNDVEVHIEHGHVHLRPPTTRQLSPAIQDGEVTTPDALSCLLERHKALFADDTAQLPGTNLLVHSIPTDDHPPVCVPLRRYAERERTVIDVQVV